MAILFIIVNKNIVPKSLFCPFDLASILFLFKTLNVHFVLHMPQGLPLSVIAVYKKHLSGPWGSYYYPALLRCCKVNTTTRYLSINMQYEDKLPASWNYQLSMQLVAKEHWSRSLGIIQLFGNWFPRGLPILKFLSIKRAYLLSSTICQLIFFTILFIHIHFCCTLVGFIFFEIDCFVHLCIYCTLNLPIPVHCFLKLWTPEW